MAHQVLIPLHTLRQGDKFRLAGRTATIEVGYHHPRLADYPEGQLMVERIE